MLHKIGKIMQEQGKKKLKSNSITQSFLNESFGAFVDEILDFASSTGNETIVVRTLVATEVLGRWEKKRKKEYRGARPWSRLGPAGPL
jgi:hypothetical protein